METSDAYATDTDTELLTGRSNLDGGDSQAVHRCSDPCLPAGSERLEVRSIVEGRVDSITRFEARGWARIPDLPNHAVDIEATLDGRVVGRTKANLHYPDLVVDGMAIAHHGFHIFFDEEVTGNSLPLIRALSPVQLPLPRFTDLTASTLEKHRPQQSGTLSMLLNDHDRFTKRGPDFEDFDPGILSRANLHTKERMPLLLAFYLPQFHQIPENDSFWGLGFTEWRQLPRGLPRFPGHYQPRTPRDLGFYNLADATTLHTQVDLAKAAGIGGFGFYYYWFDRKRILEKPLELLLNSNTEMPFLIIWANENWTRTWDGAESSVLLRQSYRPEDDLPLLDDIARHFSDRRYIRIGERPLFIIYNPRHIPDARSTIARWRSLFLSRHGIAPLMFMAQTFGQRDPRPYGLDGAIEFPPHKLSDNLFGRGRPDAYSAEFAGAVADYELFVNASLQESVPEFPLIKTVVPSWDNEARRPNRGFTLAGLSPTKYQNWLKALIERAIAHPTFDLPIVAINAWNEWAEAAYLEPDVYYGASYLNATARAYAAAIEQAARVRPDGFYD